MPSSAKARAEVWQFLAQVSPRPKQTIVDLGSGWGGLVIPLALRFPECQIVGYELSWLPWFTSKVIQRVLRLHNLKLYRQNFLQQPLPSADIVVCYLYPEGMTKLADQGRVQHWRPSYLISICFALPNHNALEKVKVSDFYQTPVYLYRL
ncbi:Putative methyltransferase [Oceanospirillum multiglobuliferum]|nr:class I SAM-dependent methyltransferase [Oceanospirillum multiglobuliferum]SJZ90078.1 Putative methyltransferase [Oceanospirillum multiglobuliferum]